MRYALFVLLVLMMGGVFAAAGDRSFPEEKPVRTAVVTVVKSQPVRSAVKAVYQSIQQTKAAGSHGSNGSSGGYGSTGK